MSKQSDEIGPRWEHIFKVLDTACETENILDGFEERFAQDVLEKVATWRENTFLTATQLSVVNRIEQKLRDRGLL
jgi:hypothetical protein